MPTTYGNDIVYCLKSHCGVRGYCRQKWVLQVQIICKFSNERTCKRNKDVQGLSCGFEVYMEPMKYLDNFIQMWWLTIILLIGVVLVLYGTCKTLFKSNYISGIWPVGIGVVLTVLALLLCVGYNNTAYYPSNADIQSSLTLSNSCSSEFTLRTMAYVSIFIPFVLAYIIIAWRSIDKKKIDDNDIKDEHAY